MLAEMPPNNPAPWAPRRPARAIICDWDGTAVVNRQEDAHALAERIEELLRLGVFFIIVTGTNFGNVDRQVCRLIAPGPRHRLIVCANRGSEVYGFDRRGRPIRRWVRQAIPDEDKALTLVAETVRDIVQEKTGLPIGIVYDRLNRRKIDLIPLPEWADPPKSAIGDLLVTVDGRLRAAGLEGGIADVVELTKQTAIERGITDPRITSDVKHIEVGLTDKADSLAWIDREIVKHEGLQWSDVLIVGDEFGPIAGFAGSDDLLRAGADGATVTSVGPEPNGAPPGVIHLGGGPVRFRELLDEQIRLIQAIGAGPWDAASAADLDVPSAPPMDLAWRIDEEGYDPSHEHAVESRFAVSNGYYGIRGALEVPTRTSRPRTFVAGFFDASPTEPAVPALVQAPNWIRLRPFLEGELLARGRGETLEYTRTLDLRHGLVWTDWRQRDREGRVIRLRTLRFASMADRSVAVQVAQVAVEQESEITLDAVIDKPWIGLARDRVGRELTLWRTAHSNGLLAVASTARLDVAGRQVPSAFAQFNGARGERWAWKAVPDQPATLVKYVSMSPGDTEDCGDVALLAIRRARRAGLRRNLAAHVQAWTERWTASDVEVDGDDEAQQALRFAIYHLNSAANPKDEHVSVGARALTGEAYMGHVFWDTEIYLLPFYTFTWPAAARAMLMYRYHTLPAAREKARELGYQGALYPWESAGGGEEATPAYVTAPDGTVVYIKNGTQEQHISADIAYAVCQYWQATGDDDFLREAGAEIVMETARFWASRAKLEEDGRFHIRQVIGPDEYHESVDDNAYTNVLAQWNIDQALEIGRYLETHSPERWAELRDKLKIAPAELEDWSAVAHGIETGLDPESGLLEQFEGFFKLDPIFISGYTMRTAPMDVVLGAERTKRSQIVKQADVVMLLQLLWDRFSPQAREANFRFYEARTGHGSSLSPVTHAVVAARLGDTGLAERYFRQAASIDFDDTMGNAALGLHIGSQGGLWQVAVLGFAGLTLRSDGLHFDPHLPDSWESLRFSVQWHGSKVRVAIHGEQRTFTASLESGGPVSVTLDTVEHRLEAGKPWTCDWNAATRQWTEATAEILD